MYKKKKKINIWIILVLVLIVAAAAGGIGYYSFSRNRSSDKEMSEELPELEKGQEYIYAKITAILGNEMTANLIENDMETDTSQTWTIPVGTDVVTKLGTTTSFSRLANGDRVRMLMQATDDGSQTILKIWIVD
jgi:hypothetical protein